MPDPKALLTAAGSSDWPGENGDEDDLPAARFTKMLVRKRLTGIICARSKGMAYGSWML